MSSIALPDQFFAAQFDFGPLRSVFEALGDRLDRLERECADLRTENDRLATDIHQATDRAHKSQKQYEALYDVVGKLNSNFSGLQSNFISKDEVTAKVKSVVAQVDAVNVRCDELSEKKMDAHSVALENKVKEIAYETSSKHISAREKEQREWFAIHLGDAETKLTELILSTQRDLRGQLENELDVVRRTSADLQGQLSTAQRDFDSSMQVMVGLNKAFVAKMETHEKTIDSVESGVQREVDSVRRSVKAVLNAFGMDLHRLHALTHDGELFEDAEDAQRGFLRSVAAAQRAHDNAKGWRVIKALHPSVGAALTTDPPEEGALDFRQFEVRRDDKLRAADHRAKALAERLTNVDAVVPLSKSGEAILSGPLMLRLRDEALKQFRLSIQTMQKELASDFGSQLQSLQRELRSKIGSQRVVELIEQYAAEMVLKETKKFGAQIERISDGMMHREDILTALTGKADARALAFKADVETVNSQVHELGSKLSETREALTDRLTAAIDAKAKEISLAKLDRRDPTYLNIVNLVQSGQAFNAPSVAAGDRCVSCGVVSGAAASADTTPTRGTRSDAADLQSREDARLQGAQEAHHQRQMRGSSAGRNRPAQNPAAANAGDWVQLMDSKFKSRMIVPAPPAPKGGASPR